MTRRTNDANSFKGTIKDMNGHVFQCYGEGTASNQFARTLEELDGYVGLHFKHNPADIKKMIRKMTDTVFDMPPAPEPTPGTTETEAPAVSASAQVFWKQEVDMYFRKKNMYENNKCALYTVIWSQCSEAMQAKVKSHDGYDAMYETSDSLALINVIKGIAYKFESQKNMYLALDDAKHAFYTSYQGADETNASYMSKFKNTIEVIQHYGGNIGDDKALMKEELKTIIGSKDPDFLENAADEDVLSAETIARQKAHAIAFLKRADKARYGLLVMELENQFTRGTDQYPKNVTETYNLLVNYKKPRAPAGRGNPRHANRGTEGERRASIAPKTN
jgi:hypothetical protein